MGQASAAADPPAVDSAAVVAAGSKESGNAILLNGVSLPAAFAPLTPAGFGWSPHPKLRTILGHPAK